MTEHRGRVTIDIDGYADRWRYHSIRAYHYLDRQADRVTVAISSSGEGLHLVGWFRDPLTFAERVELRRSLGDDPKRTDIDIERARHGVYTGVLWTEKSTNGDGRKDRDFADVYAALDHMDQQRATDADRMNRLVNEGHRAEPSMARAAHGPRGG